MSAWSLVSGQFAKGSGASSTTVQVVLPNNPTAGNVVCLGIGFVGAGGTTTISSAKDTNNNNYQVTPHSPSSFQSGCGQSFCAYLLSAPANADKTITVTFAASASFSTCYAAEYTQSLGTAVFDNDAANNGTGTAVNTPVVPVAGSDDLLFAHTNVFNLVTSANSPWTQHPSGIDGTTGWDAEYLLGGTANQAVAYTQSPSGTWSGVGMSFKITTSSVVGARRKVTQIATKFVGPSVLRYRFHRPVQTTYKAPLTQQFTQSLTATLSFIGALTVKTFKLLSGTLSFIGTLSIRTSKLLSGTLSFIGAMIKHVNTGLSATLSFIGSLVKATTKGLSGTLSFIGNLTKRVNKLLSGTLSFIGNLVSSHVTLVALTATLSFIGAMKIQTNKRLAGTLSFAGAMSKLVLKGLTAALSFVGSLLKAVQTHLTGTLSFVGNIAFGHKFTVALTATLSFVGNLATQFIAGTGAIVDYIVTFRRRRR